MDTMAPPDESPVNLLVPLVKFTSTVSRDHPPHPPRIDTTFLQTPSINRQHTSPEDRSPVQDSLASQTFEQPGFQESPERQSSGHHYLSPSTTIYSPQDTKPYPSLNPPRAELRVWDECLDRLQKHDQLTIRGWKEDIDALLLLAGLLSAIITAFIIESFKMLKPDPDDTNTVLLLQISSQLANNSLSPAVRPPEKTTTSAVRINIFWFSSLVFCLTTALIGILVKQWLRDYLNTVTASPQESARIRQFRYQGLVKWRVPEIISILPLLIQIALTFFFVGLLDLLWELDSTVAGVISVLVVLTLLFLFITTIIPAVYEDSPYRSPQAFAVYLVRMRLSKVGGYFLVWSFRILGWTQPNWPLNINVNMFRRTRRSFIVWARDAVNARYPRTWVERERLHLERHGKHFDHQIIADADSILMDTAFLKQVVRPCLKDTLEPSAALSCLLVILKNRSHTVSATGELMWKRYPSVDDGFSTLMDLVVDFLGKHATINQGDTLELLSVLGKLCKAMPFESGDPAAAALFRRVYSILAKFLSHESAVQRVAFNLMREMFTRSDGPMDSDVAEKILMYGRQAHLTKDDHTFHASCYMVLSIAHRDLSTDMSYGGLRGQLEAMLVDLELHLNEIRTSQRPHRPIPSPPLLVALLDMADIDRNLVPLPPIQLLSNIILGSSRDADSEGLCAVRRAEDLISLRSAYSGSTPRRRCAVRPVDSLGDLGLRLMPASGSHAPGDDRVIVP